MKTILVTGADGQLGQKIKDYSELYPNWKFIFADFKMIDITKFDDIKNVFESETIDALINCAAYTEVDQAETDVDNAFRVNETGSDYLAQITNKYNAHFIHVSTDYVFDGSANSPYSEDDLTNPVSVYGKSKLAGEEITFKKNKNSIVIRTSWLYSEYRKNFAKTILKFAQERDSLRVVFDQIGTPTYAGNLAKAVLSVLKNCFETKDNKAGIYHYSNLGICSWYDFAVYLLKSKNIDTYVAPVPSTEYQTKAARPAYSVLDKSKIIEKFNIEIPFWKDACDEMLDNY